MAQADDERPLQVLVLAGGIALGAYHAGVLEVLDDAGFEPDWLIATSIGAMNAALFAGNPREQRVARVQDFWTRAAFTAPLPPAPALGPLSAKLRSVASAAQSHLVGNPGLFRPRLPGSGPVPTFYDNAPLRRLLPEMVDFERLNAGPCRVTITTVDIASAAEVVFDTAEGARIGLDHLMASAGFLPDFPPVEVGGRLLGDGGHLQNAPVHLALRDARTRGRDIVCVVADLFAADAGLPRTLLASAEKGIDLLLGGQTLKALDAAAREHALRRLLAEAAGSSPDPRVEAEASMRSVHLAHLACVSDATEADAEKMYNFSRRALERRRERGSVDAKAGLEALSHPVAAGAFEIHRVRNGQVAAVS